MKIIDLHCDTISNLYKNGDTLFSNTGQYDIQRAREANVFLQFFALFTKPADANTALREILKQIDKFYCEMAANSDLVYHIKDYSDIYKAEYENKLACLLHLEGGECIGTDIEILRLLYSLGLRSIGLTWNNRNLLADGAGEGPMAGGLSRKGIDVIKEMGRLGILLDLAHISERAFFDSLFHYDRPVLVTHANSQALCGHWRNLTDNQLKALADHGGIVGITQVADFVKEDVASIDDMLDHIVHIADLIGVNYIGLGSDFDGADNMVIKSISGYRDLPELLSKRGFSPNEIEMILNANALSLLEKVL